MTIIVVFIRWTIFFLHYLHFLRGKFPRRLAKEVKIMIIAVLVTFFFYLMFADSLREFPFNSQSRKKRKEGTKELQWPGTKKICVQKEDKNSSNRFSLRFPSSPLILHSLVIISFLCCTGKWFQHKFLMKIGATAFLFPPEFLLLFVPSSMLSFIFLFSDSTANLFMIFSSP